MKNQEQERIRDKVREFYMNIAKSGEEDVKGDTTTCCGSPEAQSKSGSTPSSCCEKDHSLEEMSKKLGYSKEDVDSVPVGANMALGCGNPVALASLKPGETVVDLGSGGGFDCFLAGKEVGKNGKVIGVDMTSEMISKARNNAAKMATANVEFRLGEIENLPIADNEADIIMSNCVINLSPDKKRVYSEAYRVLKPGGRLAISDVVATAKIPEKIQKDLELVSACLGGAVTIKKIRAMLKEVGFQDVNITSNDESRDFIKDWTPKNSENAADYIVSAYIEAIKPG